MPFFHFQNDKSVARLLNSSSMSIIHTFMDGELQGKWHFVHVWQSPANSEWYTEWFNKLPYLLHSSLNCAWPFFSYWIERCFFFFSVLCVENVCVYFVRLRTERPVLEHFTFYSYKLKRNIWKFKKWEIDRFPLMHIPPQCMLTDC